MAREVVGLTGDWSALEAKLKEMPDKVAKQATFRAMRRAAKIMADEQKVQAGDSGSIPETIIVKARARNTAGFAEYGDVMRSGGTYKEASAALRAARRSGATAPSRITVTVGSTAPHAHLVEFGTVERFHKSKSDLGRFFGVHGKSTGVMPMEPFVRPAWDRKAQTCLQAIKTELEAEILRLAGKGPKIRASEAGLTDG